MNATGRHLLLYEPRTEGHHGSWLRFITEDLLSAGLRLTLAVDLRPEAEGKLRDHLGPFWSQITLMNVRNAPRGAGTDRATTVAHCLRESGADNVFLCAFDEIASAAWRRAAIGLFPPAELRGRMGGIYHRPRFMAAPKLSPARWWKQIGFQRMLAQGWLRQLIFLDEYLTADLKLKFPRAPIFFLPVPCQPCGREEGEAARRQFGIPLDKRVFLFYGGGYRRKGLHLAVEAMLALPPNLPAFLLCVGRQNPEGAIARGLDELVRQGRALVINRYVTNAEESLSFAASDAVLLPYIHHFGASGVLGQAVGAGKMVIASDEQLLGRLTRDHKLGLLFATGQSPALAECLRQTAAMPPRQMAEYAQAAETYAKLCSRETYRQALIEAVLRPNLPPQN